jgi:hypothetical protein
MPKLGFNELLIFIIIIVIEYLIIIKIKLHKKQLRSNKGIKFNQMLNLVSSYIVFIGIIVMAIIFYAQFFSW